MRFLLSLTSELPQTIPLNYEYPLSAWIYKIFSRADERFANRLHDHGYKFSGSKSFKLFTFSTSLRFNRNLLRTKSACALPALKYTGSELFRGIGRQQLQQLYQRFVPGYGDVYLKLYDLRV